MNGVYIYLVPILESPNRGISKVHNTIFLDRLDIYLGIGRILAETKFIRRLLDILSKGFRVQLAQK